MNKVSFSKISQVLADTQQVLLSVTAERDKLAAENSALLMRREAEKLASVMHNKGLRLDVEHGELASELEKEASNGRLDVIQEAVDMVAPNMGLNTQQLTNDAVTPEGATPFENYIIGDVG
jgi:hypothetical protein